MKYDWFLLHTNIVTKETEIVARFCSFMDAQLSAMALQEHSCKDVHKYSVKHKKEL